MKIHFSVDDFIIVLQELANQQAHSIFDHPVMGFFRRMHEKYGLTVSAYCFLQDNVSGAMLSKVPDVWRDEFQENTFWFKLGFHAVSSEKNYGSKKFQTGELCLTAEGAKADYDMVMAELVRITGGGACIDRMPRIHYYAGLKEICLAWKDGGYGIQGLLSAEDDRYCYYHDDEQYEHLIRQGYLEDKDTGLKFLRTDIRLENTEDVAAALDKVREKYPNKLPVVFTHEKYLYQENILKKIEQCLAY